MLLSAMQLAIKHNTLHHLEYSSNNFITVI